MAIKSAQSAFNPLLASNIQKVSYSKEPVDAFVDLPASWNTIGDQRVVLATNIMYVWDWALRNELWTSFTWALTNYLWLWNATTNSPTIVSSTWTLWDWYKVGTAGTTSIDGIASWEVNDYIWFDWLVRQKIDNQTWSSSAFFNIVSNTTLSSIHFNGIVQTTWTLTLTLPTAVGVQNSRITILKSDDYNYTVTLLTTSSQTVNGETYTYINPQYTSFTVVSDGANWKIL